MKRLMILVLTLTVLISGFMGGRLTVLIQIKDIQKGQMSGVEDARGALLLASQIGRQCGNGAYARLMFSPLRQRPNKIKALGGERMGIGGEGISVDSKEISGDERK
jgi:hypothetical protein